MNSDEVKAINGFVTLDLLDIRPHSEGINLISPITGKETGSRESYDEHPYQGLVIRCPEVYHNGGIEYPCPIKKGDIVYLTGLPIRGRETWTTFNGRTYLTVRFAELSHYVTPTPEDVKKFVFAQDDIVNPPKTLNPNGGSVIVDRKVTEKSKDITPRQEITD